MKAIETAFPKYKGEWPISHWCYKMDILEDYPRNAKVKIYDRHEDEADFIVPHLGKQSDFYKSMIKRLEVIKRKARSNLK